MEPLLTVTAPRAHAHAVSQRISCRPRRHRRPCRTSRRQICEGSYRKNGSLRAADHEIRPRHSIEQRSVSRKTGFTPASDGPRPQTTASGSRAASRPSQASRSLSRATSHIRPAWRYVESVPKPPPGQRPAVSHSRSARRTNRAYRRSSPGPEASETTAYSSTRTRTPAPAPALDRPLRLERDPVQIPEDRRSPLHTTPSERTSSPSSSIHRSSSTGSVRAVQTLEAGASMLSWRSNLGPC